MSDKLLGNVTTMSQHLLDAMISSSYLRAATIVEDRHCATGVWRMSDYRPGLRIRIW